MPEDDRPGNGGLLSAMTTEHFVLQGANASTYAEASARSSLHVMALSSTLVALGFLSSRADVFLLFAAAVLPTLFLLGLFTVSRLVETALESMHYLTGIARIRAYYRSSGASVGASTTTKRVSRVTGRCAHARTRSGSS